MVAFSTPVPQGLLLPARRHVFPRDREDRSGWSFFARRSLGALACHCLCQYCSETTQGYLRMFRDSDVNTLGLLGVHLTPGPCWVVAPRAWQTPVLEEIQCCSFFLCLGITSPGNTTMKNPGNTGDLPLPLETFTAKHPHPSQAGFLSGEGFTNTALTSDLSTECAQFLFSFQCC